MCGMELGLYIITAWLSGRTQSVKIDHFFSFPKQVLSGVLQGTALGPPLKIS